VHALTTHHTLCVALVPWFTTIVACQKTALPDPPSEPSPITASIPAPLAPSSPSDPPAAPDELVITAAGVSGIPTDRPLTVEDLQRAFPRLEAWTDTVVFENAPDYPVPVLCVGKRAACHLRLHLDADLVTRIEVLDESVRGPQGIRVGAAYRDHARDVRDCAVRMGDESGVICTVASAKRMRVTFISDELLHGPPPTTSEPRPEQLADAHVASMEWLAE
jgi:hypothetical protein